MPKGDRLKLKADPEDGTTPIANLLLEAVAMAKLSGLQKGAIIHLWRQTYGWVVDGQRLKEQKITLTDWVYALNSSKGRISVALKELEEKNIIHRRMADQWGGYYYTLNTNIASWNSNSINIARLSEIVTVHHFGTVTKSKTVTRKKDGTVTENGTEQLPKTEPPTLYKEILKKGKERGEDLTKSHLNENIRKVFKFLDNNRGYGSPKGKAEAAAIKRMLGKSYTVVQITMVWQTMKQEKFYQDKELFMMTVENQIGAVLKKSGGSPGSDKYAKQSHGHLVQR